MSGYNADVPVTDLDDRDDDIIAFEQTDDGGDVFYEDYVQDEQTVLGKVIGRVKNMFEKKSKPYKRLSGDLFAGREEIELEDYDGSNKKYQDRGGKRDPLHDPTLVEGSVMKTLVFIGSVLAFVVLLVTCSVGISNYKQGQLVTRITSLKKPMMSNGTHQFYPTTMMISLDGFHPQYISAKLTPFLHGLYGRSYGPPYMVPSFPSSTFPNHWTIVTGLYPAYHGIVGNTFYSPLSDKQFVNVKKELSMDREWWGGEPIWKTAYEHGISAAVHMWPGSQVDLKVGNPLEVDNYNGSELLSRKLDKIIGWLDRDIETRPELMLAYVPTIDSLGHKHGIAGKELEHGLRYVDNFIESIVVEIQERNLTDIVNFVIVSDHGMSPTSNDRLIILDDIVDTSKIQHIDGWPLYGLRPYEQYSIDDLYNSIKSGDHYKVYKKENLPSEWNFGNTNSSFDERIAPVWIVPNVGYAVTTREELAKNDGSYKLKGIHGYNNSEVLMRALFIGQGPYFSSRLGKHFKNKVKPFQNTQIYNLLCDTLQIKPSANNGSDPNIIFSKTQVLEDGWSDPYSYPNVSFEVDTIKEDATYDILFRHKEKTINSEQNVDTGNAVSSLLSTEKIIGTSITPESVPGATFKTKLPETSVPEATVLPSPTKQPSWLGFVGDLAEDLEKGAKDVFEEIEEDVKGLFEGLEDALSGKEKDN